MPDELDLTELTATEYLAAAADLYRIETGDQGFALSPRDEGSPLPTFSLGADFSGLGASVESEVLPGFDLLAGRKYTRSPDSDETTRQDTLEGTYGPLRGFYSETSQPGRRVTAYGGEANLGSLNIFGERVRDRDGDPLTTVGASGRGPLFGGLLQAGGSRTAGAQDPVNSYFAKWTGKAGPGTLGLDAGLRGRDKNVAASYGMENPFGLGGNLRVGADYADPEGRKPFVGGRVGYGVTF
jgi:hypothetical protein